MFRNDFQRGSHVEVFTAQGKEPLAYWAVTGAGSIKKCFDKEVKSFIYGLEGSTTSTKIQLPKDPKKLTLGLIQKYLVLQIIVSKGQDFSIDLGVIDDGNNRHHLILSTAYRTTSSTQLHAKIALGMLVKAKWLNLVLDLGSLVRELWQPHSYKALESLCLSGSCRLRRIFTMKSQPLDTSSDEELYHFRGTNSHADIESIPKQCQFMVDVSTDTQVINMTKVRCYEGRGDNVEGSNGRPNSGHEAELNSSGGKRPGSQDGYHIAFGTKVSGVSQPKKSHTREGSATSRQIRSSHGRSRSDASPDTICVNRPPKSNRQPEPAHSTRRESRTAGRERKNSDPGANIEDPDIAVDKDSLRTSHTWTDGADDKSKIPFVKPHPPKEPSSGHVHRRRPRVKSAGSAGKERTLSTSSASGHGSREDNSQLVDHTNSSGYLSMLNSQSIQGSALVMATDEEEKRILHQLHQPDRLESESDPSSHNTSATQDAEDSLSEIINTLKGQRLHEGNPPATHIEASDEIDGRNYPDKNVFVYRSRPKTVPRNKVIKKKRTRHNRSHPEQTTDLNCTSKKDVSPHMDDFPQQNSSDEEQSVRTRLKRVVPSPRKSNQPKNSKSFNKNEPVIPASGGGQTPGNSQSRCCINRKSLREITSEELVELRSSMKSPKKYNPDDYCKMVSLSDSFEERMLQAMTKETMEGSPSEDEKPTRNSKLFNYVANDSSDDTTSTPRPTAAYKQGGHNYTHEIEGAMLTQSNPRDWMYSPPIVLPGATPSEKMTPITVAQNNDNTQLDTDDEKELELLYDPGMNYYFDPQTGKYYELVRYGADDGR